ncbi:hypothetical protein Dda_0238 [Drechslerella dactyloides]|uniref:Uncharacterized protein n=1 Tax=Drechslerella dactyloides TaxID=74499 RepID=A0AAD6J4S7_DREDA|nr:hypothetical protein Dda_0238 [Drechslerella dactyloides]
MQRHQASTESVVWTALTTMSGSRQQARQPSAPVASPQPQPQSQPRRGEFWRDWKEQEEQEEQRQLQELQKLQKSQKLQKLQELQEQQQLQELQKRQEQQRQQQLQQLQRAQQPNDQSSGQLVRQPQTRYQPAAATQATADPSVCSQFSRSPSPRASTPEYIYTPSAYAAFIPGDGIGSDHEDEDGIWDQYAPCTVRVQSENAPEMRAYHAIGAELESPSGGELGPSEELGVERRKQDVEHESADGYNLRTRQTSPDSSRPRHIPSQTPTDSAIPEQPVPARGSSRFPTPVRQNALPSPNCASDGALTRISHPQVEKSPAPPTRQDALSLPRKRLLEERLARINATRVTEENLSNGNVKRQVTFHDDKCSGSLLQPQSIIELEDDGPGCWGSPMARVTDPGSSPDEPQPQDQQRSPQQRPPQQRSPQERPPQERPPQQQQQQQQQRSQTQQQPQQSQRRQQQQGPQQQQQPQQQPQPPRMTRPGPPAPSVSDVPDAGWSPPPPRQDQGPPPDGRPGPDGLPLHPPYPCGQQGCPICGNGAALAVLQENAARLTHTAVQNAQNNLHAQYAVVLETSRQLKDKIEADAAENEKKMAAENQALQKEIAARDQQLSKLEQKNKKLEQIAEREAAARQEEVEKREHLTDLNRARIGFVPFVQKPPSPPPKRKAAPKGIVIQLE